MVDYEFTKGNFTEAELEHAIMELFDKQGYILLSGENLHRRYKDVLLLDDLTIYLQKRYNGELSEIELQTAINKLNLINESPLYSGNREAFHLVTEGFDLAREDASKVALHINYIDFDEPDKNTFKVINQYAVQDKHLRRPDLLLFINGIPVAIFEFKSAIEEDKTIYDAWKQITVRYVRDIPRLLTYSFLSVISDGANTRMGTIFTPYEYYYAWNKANDKDKVANGISSLLTMIEGALAKDRILKILRDFIFYPDDSKKNEAIVCRYPQYFGAEKMLGSIRTHLRPDGDGKGGTYFGATGSGKTYLMLFLARLLVCRENDIMSNPTVIIIVDRDDLNTQTADLFVTAKQYLHEADVRSIESRWDLCNTLNDRPSGGVYITTIQKFCETTGLLSERSNIICISDEAHRTQTSVGAKVKLTEQGALTSYGFGHHLHSSFPNAVYCGFTGTPIDTTIAVFGPVVDSYTMKEASDDGITVRIAYEPRLARVMVSEEKAQEIEKYYQQWAAAGSSDAQIDASKHDMANMPELIGNPDRIAKLAADIIRHYESLCAEKPKVVQKAMIVCADRTIALHVLRAIGLLRPEWRQRKKSENEDGLSKTQLDKLEALPKIILVATPRQDDIGELYAACGSREYRKMLEKQFKDVNSNFRIAIVVDMWITGFDVPSLAVMYVDKPMQKHTLIQTISRVNRVFAGKDKGLVVDYIGIKNEMLEAIKQYGAPKETPVDELEISLSIFRNHLAMIAELLHGFNAERFFSGKPLERLICLNNAAEFIQELKDRQTCFMGLARKLKSAYAICFPSGTLADRETAQAQFYLAVRSIIYKQTKGDAPDTETMNRIVETMVREAITCTGIENIIDEHKSIDLFSDEFMNELDKVKMPITKFNALLKLLKKAVLSYGRTNKVKAAAFDEMLKKVVEAYNTRDKLVFTSEVISDFVNDLSDQLMDIFKKLKEDRESFNKMGITYEEKAFYDILVKVRDDHGFPYAKEKCLLLAAKIKELVDDNAHYADWSSREDIKSQLNMKLTVLLYQNGYPPEWDEEVFNKVMEQAENFKKYQEPDIGTVSLDRHEGKSYESDLQRTAEQKAAETYVKYDKH